MNIILEIDGLAQRLKQSAKAEERLLAVMLSVVLFWYGIGGPGWAGMIGAVSTYNDIAMNHLRHGQNAMNN